MVKRLKLLSTIVKVFHDFLVSLSSQGRCARNRQKLVQIRRSSSKVQSYHPKPRSGRTGHFWTFLGGVVVVVPMADVFSLGSIDPEKVHGLDLP